MDKCICIKDNSEDIRWNPFLKKISQGELYFYEKTKIKFNTKKQRFKIVKPTQMGRYLYEIYDIDKNKISEFDESSFIQHFETKSIIRTELIENLLNEK